MNDLSSEQIKWRLDQLVEGELEAQAWLYDQFAADLARKLAWRYPELDTADLLHDSFVYYWQNNSKVLNRALGSLAPDQLTMGRLKTVLWNAACGIASNRRRAARRQPTFFSPRETDSVTQLGPERVSLSRELLSRLVSCLSEKGDRIFLYFNLRYCDGLKPREILRFTGWPQNEVNGLGRKVKQAVALCAKALDLVCE